MQVALTDRPTVKAGWTLGFAVEGNTIPFTFDYVTDPTKSDREIVIDLIQPPGTYSVGDVKEAHALYGERVEHSFGVAIDPCRCSDISLACYRMRVNDWNKLFSFQIILLK